MEELRRGVNPPALRALNDFALWVVSEVDVAQHLPEVSCGGFRSIERPSHRRTLGSTGLHQLEVADELSAT